MPELTTAWITLAATTKGMEADIRKAINRAERGTKISPEVDRSELNREADRAGRSFGSRFNAASSRESVSGGSAAGKAFLGAFGGFLSAQALGALASRGAQAVVDEFKNIFETGLDFSKTMNNFQGVTRASTAEMARMQSAARALGSDTHLAGASASDAALAMTELAKAGFSVDQSIAAARGTLELATAGQIDAASAAEIQSNAMNAFGLSATSAAHTADLFANAAVASSADIPDLGLALQQVGGIAHGFGENLDDTIAALAIFANAGVKGSDAGTLLKTTMQSITDQGAPAQEAIHQLNLQLYDMDSHQFVGFRELFRQLDIAKKRMSPEEFQAQTNVLFGSDAMRSAMLGNQQAFDEMLNNLNRVGAAGELAGAQMQGLPGAVEGMKNAMEGVRLDVFDAIGPQATAGLNQIVEWTSTHKADVVAFFTDIADAAVGMGQVIVQATGLTLEGFGELAGGLGNIVGGILKAGASLQRLIGDDDTADQWQREAEAAFGWGESMQEVGGKLKNVKFDGIRDSIRETGERTAEAAKLTTALGDAVAKVPDGKTILIEDNSPETIARLKAIGVQVEETPTGLKLTATTDDAQRILDAFRQQQTGQPIEPSVMPSVTAANAAMKAFVDQWSSAVIDPKVVVPGQGAPAQSPLAIIAPTAPHRAGGGPIFGAGTGTSDSIPALLSNGEHVWTADEVNKAGGQGAMYAMRSMVRRFAGGGSADGLTPNAQQLKAIIQQAFPQITNIGGWRPPDGYNEHSSGQALDLMIPNPNSPEGKALGDQINQWLLQNADSLGIQYDLWQQQDWKPDGSVSGMENRGGATANHMDHVHVRVKPGQATGASLGALNAQSGANGSYEVDQQAVFDAETRVMRDRNDLEVQRKQLAELESKGTATESQLLAARNDVAEQERDVQSSEAKLAEARQGKLKKVKDSAGSGSGGGMDGSGLGESIFGGILQGMGLDGSVFSNPFEWPNVKSAMALANWGGGLLKGALGGEDDGSTPLGGTGGGGFGGLNLPGISDILKPIGPQAMSPLGGVSAGQGAGPAPGPTYQINGNVGMDPKAVTQKFDAAHNQSYRKTVGSVRPS